MERLGWLERIESGGGNSRRREYVLSSKGSEVLECLRNSIAELHEELAETRCRRRAKAAARVGLRRERPNAV